MVTETGKGMVKYKTSRGEITLTEGDVRALCPLASDDEVLKFLKLCQYQGLNPFLSEAYLIKYKKEAPASMVVAKQVFVARASAHPAFNGMPSGVLVQKGQEIIERIGECALPGDTLIGGWAIVHRKDHDHPTHCRVSLKEYSTGMSTWKAMPETMIVKVAEHHALRKAFPDDFQGLYSEEEMGKAIEERHANPSPVIQGTSHVVDIVDSEASTSAESGFDVSSMTCPIHKDTDGEPQHWDNGAYGPFHRLYNEAGEAEVYTTGSQKGKKKRVKPPQCYVEALKWPDAQMGKWIKDNLQVDKWYDLDADGQRQGLVALALEYDAKLKLAEQANQDEVAEEGSQDDLYGEE